MRTTLVLALPCLLVPALRADYQTTLPRSVSVRDGDWTDGSTWDTPPDKSRCVIIRHRIRLNGGEAGFIGIDPGATATLAGSFHSYGSVVVSGGAEFLSAPSGTLLFHVPNDRTFVGNTTPGPDPTDPDNHSGTDIGLWGLANSTIRLVGPLVTPWVEVLPETDAGSRPLLPVGAAVPAIRAGRAALKTAPEGWLPGDRLLLVAPNGQYALATLTTLGGAATPADLTLPVLPPWKPGETRTIADPTGAFLRVLVQEAGTPPPGNVLTFSGADNFVGEVYTVEGRTVAPLVANLSRRVVVASADVREGDTNHRAHTVYGAGCRVTLDNVEFCDLGPRAKLGRYPVHFHHTGSPDGGGLLSGCSVHGTTTDAGSRFVSIHGATSGIAVKNNVALRSQGHGYFLEDGREVNNTLTDNLSVDVRGPEELTVKDAISSSGSHHFWMRSGNTLDRNRAVSPPVSWLSGLRTVDGTPVQPARTAMTVLAHRTTAPHTETTVAGLSAWGQMDYGFWTTGHPVKLDRPIFVEAGLSGTGPTVYPQFSKLPPKLTLTDPAILYCGSVSSSVYRSGLYASDEREPTVVTGGLVVGSRAFHLHYNPAMTCVGTKFRVGDFADPTYWESAVLLDGCDLTHTGRMWANPYGKRYAPSGIIRFRNCIGSIDGGTWTAANPLTRDYSHHSDPLLAAYPGTVMTINGTAVAKRLNAPLPESGFVELPAPFLPFKATWSIVPTGSTATPRAFVRQETKERWQVLRPSVGGYQVGIPPGTYDVTATTTVAPIVSKTWAGVVVTSGQVATLQ